MHAIYTYQLHRNSDEEDASSMVTAGATANTTEGNNRASRESGLLLFSHSHGVARTVVAPPMSVVKCLWEVFVWRSCRARVCAGVGGVFSVGVSCVRVTC